MNLLSFQGKTYRLQGHESVLDCLLRNGQAVPYACKAGMCQACLVKAVDCEATEISRKWIKPALQARGFTLACQWVPEQDAKVELPGLEDFAKAVEVKVLRKLNDSIMQVILVPIEPATMFACRPGQYLNLINPDGIIRSYSLANDFAHDGVLELHVAATSHGEFTQWLFSKASVGMTLHVRGPAGDCYYKPEEDSDYPVVLAGTGSGLAPLHGILLDALAHGHAGPISLYHGAGTPQQLYLVQELEAIAAAHTNFTYYPCVRQNADDSCQNGTVESVLDQRLDTRHIANTRFYLSGAPKFVHAMHKRVYLKGARAANIHSDPFTERTVIKTRN